MAQDDDVEYYRRIFNYVQAKGRKALVIQNPGKTLPRDSWSCRCLHDVRETQFSLRRL